MHNANFEIIPVSESDQAVLVNLLALYVHDMGECFDVDIDASGHYDYDLSSYWKRNQPAYLLKVDDLPAGFALLDETNEPGEIDKGYEIKEFFVIRRHRHTGVAGGFVKSLWDRHEGFWSVRVLADNLPAVPFWRRVIADYSQGQYVESQKLLEVRRWYIFSFNNS